ATVAWYEDDGLPLGPAPTVRLAPSAGRFLLERCKRSVPFGAEAGLVLVPATIGTERVLVAVHAGARAPSAAAAALREGVGRIEVAPCGTIDGLPAADIRFAALALDAAAVVARGSAAESLLAWMRDAWLVVSFADALGAMRRLVDMTGEYLG